MINITLVSITMVFIIRFFFVSSYKCYDITIVKISDYEYTVELDSSSSCLMFLNDILIISGRQCYAIIVAYELCVLTNGGVLLNTYSMMFVIIDKHITR